MFSLKNFKTPEGQLTRWLEIISVYKFDIEEGEAIYTLVLFSQRPCSDTISRYCEKVEQKELQYIQSEIIVEDKAVNVTNTDSDSTDV